MLIALLVVFPITGQSQTLAVDGLSLPFQIIKAVNGVPVQEWKIEKYKINPDLKAKKFEKK